MDFLHRRECQQPEIELARQPFSPRTLPAPQPLHGPGPEADQALSRENSPLYARTDPGATPDQQSFDPKPKTKLEKLKDKFDDEEDPAKKLKAWKDYYLEVVNTKTSSMKENPFKKDIKDTIKDSEGTEADDEIARLSKKKDLSKEDIEKLDKRKQLELNIEVNNHVNLKEDISHANPKNAQSGRWSVEQLKKLQKTLAVLPENDVKNNPRLLEFVRSGDISEGNDKSALAHFNPAVNNVMVFDKIDNWRGEKEEFEQSIAHEVGHSVYFRLKDSKEGQSILDRYEALTGWKNFKDKKALVSQMTGGKEDDKSLANAEADIKRLEAVRGEGFQKREEPQNQVTVNGKRCMVDPYNKNGYISAPAENLPESDDFAYARSSPWEYFAEQYSYNFFQ